MALIYGYRITPTNRLYLYHNDHNDMKTLYVYWLFMRRNHSPWGILFAKGKFSKICVFFDSGLDILLSMHSRF